MEMNEMNPGTLIKKKVKVSNSIMVRQLHDILT